VTNGVRAMVEAMESAGLQAPSDPRLCQSAAEELGGAENPVLESSQLGDPDIWGGFGRSLSHGESKSPQGPDRAPSVREA
jgi:hypothetical protein